MKLKEMIKRTFSMKASLAAVFALIAAVFMNAGVQAAPGDPLTFAAGSVFNAIVGKGGQRGDSGANRRGGDSTFTLAGTNVVAYGSGGGNSWNGQQGTAGASTGGGTSNNGGSVVNTLALDPPQGHKGGATSGGTYGIGGGGGGYSEAGGNAYSSTREVNETMVSYTQGGKGGDGYDSSITGEEHTYGSGGGGAAGWANNGGNLVYNLPGDGGKESGGRGGHTVLDHGNTNLSGVNGTDGLGGGGGGGGHNNNLSVSKAAGNGGFGTVIFAIEELQSGDKAFAVDPISSQPMTGEALTPVPVVKDARSGAPLDSSNYDIVYQNNISAGMATVSIFGKGDYEGAVAAVEFRIVASRRFGKDIYLFLGGANMYTGAQAGGPSIAVSNIMANAEANAEVVIVNAAVNSSRLSTWIKGGANYSSALTKARTAVEAGGAIRAIFWHQGEADSSDSAVCGAYATTLAGIVADLRDELSLADSIPFIASTILETSQSGVVGCREINENLRKLPSLVAGAYVADSRDLQQNAWNSLLLTAESVRTLGLRMANAFFENERKFVNSGLVVGELGPQAISGSDVIAPAVKVTDPSGAVIDAANFEIAYRGVSGTGFGVAVVTGRDGTPYENMTNFAPFRVMSPVFVTPDGDAEADGSSWDNATTFANAVTIANGSREVWLKKGVYTWSASYNMVKTMFIRGGFEGKAGDRLDGEYSIIDGGRSIGSLFTGTHTGDPESASYKTMFERIDFRGSNGTGIDHRGRGTFLVRDCRFSNMNTGISVGSAYGNQEVTIRSSYFHNIILPDTTWGSGVPISIGNAINAVVENCQFVSNGVPWTHNYPSGTLHGKGRVIASDCPIDVIGCEFRANRMTASVNNGSRIIGLGSYARRVRVERCLFAGNELIGRSKGDSQWGGAVDSNPDSGIIYFAGGSGRTVDILNCTFAYNLVDNGVASTVSVTGGNLCIRNTIFFGNVTSSDNSTGSDIYLKGSTATADIAYSLFAEDSEKYFYAAYGGEYTIDRPTMVFQDPLFVTPQATVTNLIRNTSSGTATINATRWRSNFAYDKTVAVRDQVTAFDCHLRSAAGTRLNDGTWTTFPGESSPAIDKGDPEADFSAEPEPNGSRLNLGYYGGTAESSKTLESFPGLADDEIDITFPDGISQPRVAFEVVDTHGGAFSADVTVYVGTDEDGWTVTNEYHSVAAGTPFDSLVADCYRTGRTLKVKVIVEAGGKTVTKTVEKTVTGELSPYYGKRGEGVFHVRPGATGRGDGSDWFHAFDGCVQDALVYKNKLEDDTASELWYAAMTNSIAEPKSTLTPAIPLVIRGGFTGIETNAAERVGWRTVAVAGGLRVPMAAENTVALTIENFEFTDGAGRGFEKTKSGDLTFANCRFFGNIRSGVVNGRGLNATGTAGTTTLVISNCVFEGNSNTDLGTSGDVGSGSGGALYVSNFRRVVIDDSLFLTNGLIWKVSHPKSGNSGMSGSAIYASNAPLTVRRTAFRGNRGGTSRTQGEAGIVALNSGTAGSAFTNCLFIGNHESWHQNNGPGNYGGALKINTGDTNVYVTVNNCTFFGNLVDGIALGAAMNVVSGAAMIRNSVFNRNLLGASKSGEYAEDLVVHSNAKADVYYTLFEAEETVREKSGGNLLLGDGVIYGDAKLVTPKSETEDIVQQTDSCTVFKPAVRSAVLGWDVHPRSQAGTCLNDGTWTNYEGEVSVAIDTGDPNAPYALEPAPNGSRLNLGAYGNTAEASKKQEANPAIENDEISITFPNGITMPQVEFTVVDAEGGTFSAVVTVNVGTGTVYNVTKVFGDVAPGDRITMVAGECYLPGETLNVRVLVEAGGKLVDVTEHATVTGEVSPYYGKGGQGVFHVRPGAMGRNDGSDWFNAFDGSFQEALTHIAPEVTEVWVAAKTNTVNRNHSNFTWSKAMTIRGGFRGTENTAEERIPGEYTVVDGQNTYTPFAVDTVPGMTLEDFSFENGASRGFYKNYEGDLTLIRCRFVRNGLNRKGKVEGRGAYLKGTYLNSPSSTPSTLTLTDCLFADNYNPDLYDNASVDSGTGGAYIWNWKRVVMDNCVFTNNCNKFGYSVTSNGGNDCRGSAFWANNAPVTCRSCRFCFNHGATAPANDFGGTVALASGTGGSVFTNCLFFGNVENWHMNRQPGWNSGALRVETGSTSKPVEVVNCTIAANLSDGATCSAGLNVISGRVKLLNSIIFANRVGYHRSQSAADDMIVRTNAIVDVAYSLFTSQDSVRALLGGTINCGEGVKYGDPRFVTAYETITNAIVDVNGSQGMTTWFAPAKRGDILGGNVHLLGGAGYYDETSGKLLKFRGAKSPAIDAGDPAGAYSGEPDIDGVGTNGKRVNMGFYGNTPWATMSHLNGNVLRLR